MHQDQNKVRLTKITCAGCGNPIPPFDKGAECSRCKTWPLCEKCLDKPENPISCGRPGRVHGHVCAIPVTPQRVCSPARVAAYKAKRKPECNSGLGCPACWAKWKQENPDATSTD